MSEADRSPLEKLTAHYLNSALHTSKTFYKMAKWYSRIGRILDVAAIVAATLVTVSVVWDAVPNQVYAVAAVIVGLLTYTTQLFNFETKAEKARRLGEEYNSIVHELRKYNQLVLQDEDTDESTKKQKFERLYDRYQKLNSASDTTKEWAYGRIDSRAIVENSQTTDEEAERLLETVTRDTAAEK